MKSAGSVGAVACALALTLLAGCNFGNSDSAIQPAASAQSGVSAQPPLGQVLSQTASASSSSSSDSTGATATTPTAADSTVTLNWLPPTVNTDGSAITDLAGYRIYYGTNEGALDQVIDISNVGITTYVIDGLTAGTWYFAIRAYTADGTESALSNVAMKTIA